jgi:hypothetical protein
LWNFVLASYGGGILLLVDVDHRLTGDKGRWSSNGGLLALPEIRRQRSMFASRGLVGNPPAFAVAQWFLEIRLDC